MLLLFHIQVKAVWHQLNTLMNEQMCIRDTENGTAIRKYHTKCDCSYPSTESYYLLVLGILRDFVDSSMERQKLPYISIYFTS